MTETFKSKKLGLSNTKQKRNPLILHMILYICNVMFRVIYVMFDSMIARWIEQWWVIIINNNNNSNWNAKKSIKGSTTMHCKQPILVCHYKTFSSKTGTKKLHVLITQWILAYWLTSVGSGKNGESLDIFT